MNPTKSTFGDPTFAPGTLQQFNEMFEFHGLNELRLSFQPFLCVVSSVYVLYYKILYR